ncbi:tyrosine-protein phosphatase [Prolixibacteraceae bacterium JC049]|nr:tyrosine-protein phosphatase [Prolixibacteraceae bacterium JC049]
MNRLLELLPVLAIFVLVCCAMNANGNDTSKSIEKSKDQFDLRVVKLNGAHNLRDLGGVRNKSGRLVKTGIVFRSDKLTDLTEEDLAKLEMLRVRKVLDLRSVIEVNLKADKMPRGARFFHRQIGHEAVDPVDFTKKLLSGYWTGEGFADDAIKGYRIMVIEGKSVFPQIIRDILNNKEGATVFHCAGGKDRTGLVSALILSILEVPREIIFQDYLYTNIQRKEQFVHKFTKLKKATNNKIKDDLLAAMKAHKSYLQSAFDTIEKEFGGMDRYVKSYLGITAEEIHLLKSKMLK